MRHQAGDDAAAGRSGLLEAPSCLREQGPKLESSWSFTGRCGKAAPHQIDYGWRSLLRDLLLSQTRWMPCCQFILKLLHRDVFAIGNAKFKHFIHQHAKPPYICRWTI